TVDDRPYLQPIDDLETTADTPVTFTIPGVDVEGDAIQYSGTVVSDSGTLGLTGDPTTGVATVTPLAGPGVYAISVTVTGDSGSDSQIVPVLVRPTAPTNLDLATSSDTGASSTDSLTNLNNTSGKELSIWVSGLTVGAEVMLYADGQLIGQLTATSTTALIVTNGAVTLADGEHVITAVQTLPNQSIDYGNRDETVDLVSPTSAALIITVDTTKPQITSTSVGDALAGVQYVYDVESDVEAAGEAHYELSVAPPGMLINSQTGKITWTPQASHGISQNVVVVVEDEAGNHAQQTFLIEINQAPVIWAIDNQLVTELDTLTVEVVAQEDNGDLPITFSLAAGAPEGAAIDAQTGLFTWTPTEAQGPGAYDITVVATDSAGAVAHKKFRVTVTEENLVPVLDPIADATTAEGQLLQIDVTATDPDLPANTIQYGLGSGAPAGAAIDPTTGRFTWTPGESFGGQTVPIVVRVTDSAGATDEKTFHITVTEVDDPPVFTPINAELTVLPGGTLRVQVEAFDPDVPTNPVRYALEPGAPEGVTLDPVTGLLIWEVPNDFPMGTVDVAVRATEMLDDQTPGLETVGALRVQVINPAAFLLDQTLALSGRTAFGRQVAREAVEALLLQTREPRVRFVSAPVTPPPASDPLGFQIASNLRGEEPTKPAKHKKDQSDAKPTEDESVEPANYEETAPTDYPAPDDMPESAEAIQELAPPEVLDATLEMLADEAVAAACEAVADEVAAGSTG
ncbi:MAG: putative Ig domain-containing protein, partial [Pirellulales bacterium]|nr:putative Ig domain-containing protein [Pirellulales bacterium]